MLTNTSVSGGNIRSTSQMIGVKIKNIVLWQSNSCKSFSRLYRCWFHGFFSTLQNTKTKQLGLVFYFVYLTTSANLFYSLSRKSKETLWNLRLITTFKKAQSLKTFAQQSPLLRNLRRAGDICAAVETFKNSSQSWGIGISNFKNNHNLK